MESTYSRHQEYEHPDTEIRIRRRRRKPRVRSRSRYATTEDSDSQRSDLNHSGNEKQEIDRADDEDGGTLTLPNLYTPYGLLRYSRGTGSTWGNS